MRVYAIVALIIVLEIVVMLSYVMQYGAPLSAVVRLARQRRGMSHICRLQAQTVFPPDLPSRARLAAPAAVRVSDCTCDGPRLMQRPHHANITIRSSVDVHVYIHNGQSCELCFRSDPTAIVLDFSDNPVVTIGGSQQHAFKTFVVDCSPANVVPIPFPVFTVFPEQLQTDRRYLVTFLGTFYLLLEGTERLDLLALHQPEAGVVVMGRCHKHHGEHLLQLFFAFCLRLDYQVDAFGDTSQLANTTFGLVPVGRQPASFRLAELLHQNIIPVLIVPSSFILPFADLFDWDDVSFRFPPERVHLAIPALRRVTRERIARMQANIRKIVHLFDLKKIIMYALNTSGIDVV
jgi:hypothetical protein